MPGNSSNALFRNISAISFSERSSANRPPFGQSRRRVLAQGETVQRESEQQVWPIAGLALLGQALDARMALKFPCIFPVKQRLTGEKSSIATLNTAMDSFKFERRLNTLALRDPTTAVSNNSEHQ